MREYNERGKRMKNPLDEPGFPNMFTVTASGERLYYKSVEPDDIFIQDIATHLAYTIRWCGVLRQHYTTAEHSVAMAEYALRCELRDLPEPVKGFRLMFAFACLMHDSEEWITGDIPSPFKAFFPGISEYGDYVRQIIYKKYHIPYWLYDVVKEWDHRILFTEACQWLTNGRLAIAGGQDNYLTPTLPVQLHAWCNEQARREFLSVFTRLA